MAGTASADPGLHVSAGGNDVVKIGDGSATTSKGNYAVAFNGGKADASATGTSNLAIAGVDSRVRIENGDHNVAVALDGSGAFIQGKGNNNLVFSNHNSGAAIDEGDNNRVVSVQDSFVAVTLGPGDRINNTVNVAQCGGSIIASQSDKITTSGSCNN